MARGFEISVSRMFEEHFFNGLLRKQKLVCRIVMTFAHNCYLSKLLSPRFHITTLC